MLEKERIKELNEEKEGEMLIENEKKIKEKEEQEKINLIKKDNLEKNKKMMNINNKSSTNFYKIDKNLSNNFNNQKKKATPNENFSAKKIASELIKKNPNKIKTLSYSNSTRDIYSDKAIYKNLNNYNSNNFNNKKKYPIPVNNINYIQNYKKLKQNDSNVFTPPFSKGANSNTNININNFYLNNVFSSIHNNYMTNNSNNMLANYYSKNNKEIQKKHTSNRASSVFN